MKDRVIAHINIIGFKSAVAAIKDKNLLGRPFVIAGSANGRSLALDCSPEAIRQGLTPGTSLAVAERKITDLIILPPDPSAYEQMNRELEKVTERYAPLWENDKQGNLYLDITGTTSLFGSPLDCSNRILKEMLEKAQIRPAAAVACNKLVSKVATRSIRPMGLIQIQTGTEADFLSHQDIHLLPGMGAKLLNTAAVVGIRQIGEIAALSKSGVLSLFGKHGLTLRDMALGIDNSPVLDRNNKKRIILKADFNEDIIEIIAIKGAILTLAENGGLQMRNEKLGTKNLQLTIFYSDGIETQGVEKPINILVTNNEIMTAAYNLYKTIATRRIRIRSIALVLEDLTPLSYQPDLFEPETETKQKRLQEAIDKIQNKYGTAKIKRCLSIVPDTKKRIPHAN